MRVKAPLAGEEYAEKCAASWRAKYDAYVLWSMWEPAKRTHVTKEIGDDVGESIAEEAET